MNKKILIVLITLICNSITGFAFDTNYNSCFIENKGQLHDQYNNKRNDIISFVEGGKYNCYIKPNGISYQLYKGFKKDRDTNQYFNINRIDFQYLNTNSNTKTELSGLNKDYINYYLDSNEKGITNVKTAKELLIHDLYNNIDLKYYFKEANLEYDFIVKPNGNINDIKIKIDGSNSLKIDKDGNLIISTVNGDLLQNKPIARQENKIIETKWVIRNEGVGLTIEAYDHSKTLIIDPLVKQWGTYYAVGNEWGNAISTDINKNLIFSSTVNTNNPLLATTGAFQTTSPSTPSAIIAKFNSSGLRLWATFYGNGTYINDNTTDSLGNVYITGYTSATIGIATTNSYLSTKPSFNNNCAFIAKFDQNGTRTYGTYYGGSGTSTNYSYDYGMSIKLDNLNNIILLGQTTSQTGIASATAHQISNSSGSGSTDIFIVKFSQTFSRMWATYLGGTDYEQTGINSLNIDNQNNIIVCGNSYSATTSNIALNGFLNTSNPISYYVSCNCYSQSSIPFLVKFNSNGVRIWGTYYGNTYYSNFSNFILKSSGCVSDKNGNVYLFGNTNCQGSIVGINNSYPQFTTINAYQASCNCSQQSTSTGTTIVSEQYGYIIKFNSNGARIYGTYVPGADNINGATIDSFNNLFIIGETNTITNSLIATTNNALQMNSGGGTDIYLMKFDSLGQRSWGTFLGGANNENGYDICVNNDYTIYISGRSYSINNISTTGAYQPYLDLANNTNGNNGIIIKIGDCNIPSPIVQFSNNGIICNNNPVILSTAANSNYTYQWKLNGNNISGATSNIYSTTISGNYTVEISNAAGCKSESNPLNITSSTIAATITNYNISTICQGNSVTLYAPTGYVFYQWRNNGISIIGANTNTLNVTQSGTYSAIIMSSNYCSAVSNDISITVNNNPIASISAMSPTSFCTGNSVVLSAQTAPGNIYNWRLNGVLISGANTATYIANTSGIYDVVVTNSSNCSTISNAITLTEIANPIANISSSGPTSFCQGNSVTLSTPSGIGYSYQWKLNGTIINNATSNNYVASAAGTYQVTVTNANNCSSSNTTTISNYTNPTANIVPNGSTSICQGNTLQLTAPVAPGYTYSFNWKLNGTTITGATTNTYIANQFGNYTVTITDINNCSTTSPVLTVIQLPQPTAIISSNNITSACQGDSILLSANTNPSYTYLWKYNGNSILNATNSTYKAFQTGNYSVEITNTNNCTSISNTIPIIINPKPVANISASGPTNFCIGNFVNLNSFSQNNVTYQWILNGNIISGNANNSYNAYQQGDYKLKVTSQLGCETISNTITVITYPIPTSTISAVGNLTICQGDSVKLITNNNSYNYQWKFYSINITNATDSQYYAKQSGTYTLNTSNGYCNSTSNAINVNVIPIPNTPIYINGKTNLCQGDTCMLTTAQSSNYTYQWFANNTLLPNQNLYNIKIGTPGAYKVMITDGNCSNSSGLISINVKALPNPIIQFINGILSCTNNTYLNYKWFLNGVLLLNATTSSFYPTLNGTYKVQVLEDSCWGQSQDFYLSNLSVNYIGSNKVKFFPNPTNDIVYFEGIEIEKINIYSINGQYLETCLKSNKIDLSKYTSGNYIIKIFDVINQLISIEKISKL